MAIHLIPAGCCTTETPPACPADTNGDYNVNLTDLSALLASYGTPSGAGRAQGDLDSDGDVDLIDLSTLLTNFGTNCCANPPPSPVQGAVATTVQAYDTGGYTGGGFFGESKQFVFDVLVTIGTGADDWTGAGVTITTSNSASL